jgi:hypothetical protein
MSEQLTTASTSIGSVTAEFAYNDWVMLEAPGGSFQRQIRKRKDLDSALAELGVPAAEIEAASEALWASRPQDAHLETPRPLEGRASMMSGSTFVALFLAIVVLGSLLVALIILVFFSERLPG